MTDILTICKRCGGDASYVTRDMRFVSTTCLGCGYTSNNQLKEGSKYQQEAEEKMPELFKDVKFVDLDGFVHYPATLNFPEKGMVFLNGSSAKNCYWSAMLVTKVLDEEKERFKKPGEENEYFTYKMDPKTLKNFDYKTGFMDAMEYLGCFKQE